jgi:hypothetical protein
MSGFLADGYKRACSSLLEEYQKDIAQLKAKMKLASSLNELQQLERDLADRKNRYDLQVKSLRRSLY